MTHPPTPEDELEQILEGHYRWTIETVNKAIKCSKDGLRQPILGTGNAPLLAPSETKAALLARERRLCLEARRGEVSSLQSYYERYTATTFANIKLMIKHELYRLDTELGEGKN